VSSFEMEKHGKKFVYSFAEKLPMLVVGCKEAFSHTPRLRASEPTRPCVVRVHRSCALHHYSVTSLLRMMCCCRAFRFLL